MNLQQVAYLLVVLILLEKRAALSRGSVLPASQQSELTASAERRNAILPQVDVAPKPSDENSTSDFAGGVNTTDDIATAPEQAAARSVQFVPTPVSPADRKQQASRSEAEKLALNFTTQHNRSDPIGSSAGSNSNNKSSSGRRSSSGSSNASDPLEPGPTSVASPASAVSGMITATSSESGQSAEADADDAFHASSSGDSDSDSSASSGWKSSSGSGSGSGERIPVSPGTLGHTPVPAPADKSHVSSSDQGGGGSWRTEAGRVTPGPAEYVSVTDSQDSRSHTTHLPAKSSTLLKNKEQETTEPNPSNVTVVQKDARGLTPVDLIIWITVIIVCLVCAFLVSISPAIVEFCCRRARHKFVHANKGMESLLEEAEADDVSIVGPWNVAK